MAINDFWYGARNGTRVFAPGTGIWGTISDWKEPNSLKGLNLYSMIAQAEMFRKEDFDFLPPDEQKNLADAVMQFREVTDREFKGHPIDQVDYESIRPSYQRIADSLGFDRFSDAEAFRIGRQIELAIAGTRPPELKKMLIQTGPDHSGEPAIWFWAILDDAVVDNPDFRQKKKAIRLLLESASQAIAPDRWPFVRFETVEEQIEMAEVQAA